MPTAGRRRFRTQADWHALVKEVRETDAEVDLAELRRAVYRDIEAVRKRPLFVYASKFPEAPAEAPIFIDQTDVDGFTDLIDAAGPHDSVDILIHSPGGSPEAAERIVDLLRSHFEEVAFLVPHTAYSAATMLALSANEIILHPSACLGPIDPQINGIPARSIRRGFDKVRELLKEEGPEALPAYLPLIEKHSLELLEICDDSLGLSRELATNWLLDFMFRGAREKRAVIERAVHFFSDYDTHKTHSRPLTYNKLKDLELSITLADGDLRELMREAYILLNGFFAVTPFVKVYENSGEVSWGRQFAQVIPATERGEPSHGRKPGQRGVLPANQVA